MADTQDQGPNQANPRMAADPRRRGGFIVAITLVTFFLIYWLPNDTSPDSGGSGGKQPEPGPDDPSLPIVRQLAYRIATAAGGLVYPANLSAERFYGDWSYNGHAAGRFLRPALAPNVSVQFSLPQGHGPDNLSFTDHRGDALLRLISAPPYPEVPSLQDVMGDIALFDGDAPDGTKGSTPRLMVPCKGVYAADQGLLYLIGSSMEARIAIGDSNAPAISASPSPSPTVASPSVSPAAATLQPEPSASASASAQPAAPSTPARQLGQDSSARALADGAPDRCDLLIAMRFRPVDYDPARQPQPPSSSSRRLAGVSAVGPTAEAGLASSGAGLSWPVASPAVFDYAGQQPDIGLGLDLDDLTSLGLGQDDGGLESTDAVGSDHERNFAADAAKTITAALRKLGIAVPASSSSSSSPGNPLRDLLVPRFIREAVAVGPDNSAPGGMDKPSMDGQGPPAASRFATYSSSGTGRSGRSDDRGPLPGLEDLASWATAASTASSSAGTTSMSAEEGSGYGPSGPRTAPGSSSTASSSLTAIGYLPQAWADGLTSLQDSLATSSLTQSMRQRQLASSSPTSLLPLGPGGSRGRRLASSAPADLYPGMRYVPLQGAVVSPNCNFTLNLSATALVYNYPVLEDKMSTFVFGATCAGLALLAVTTHQLVSSSAMAARVSLLTIGIQWVLDGLAAFLFLAGGLVLTTLVTSFAIPAFTHFVLFVFIQLRFLLLIKRGRNPDIFSGGVMMVQRELCKMYMLLYPLLLACFAVLYSGSASTVRMLLTVAYSYWLPQIVHSASRDSRSGLTRGYVLTTTLARLFPLAYLLMCPHNVAYFFWPPEPAATAMAWGANGAWMDPKPGKTSWMLGHTIAPAFLTPARAAVYSSWARFGMFLILWQAAQVTVLLLQSKPGWGPRFFVPYAFLPPKYDYHRRIVVSNGRVMPDPAATSLWVRHPPSEPSASSAREGGTNADGTPNTASNASVGSLVSGAVRSAWHDLQSSARGAAESARWFVAGCTLLARDLWKYTSTKMGRRFRTARARGFSFGSIMGHDDSIARTISGPVNGAGPAGDGAGSSSWLDMMSPRQRIGGVAGRYARLGADGAVGSDEGLSGGPGSTVLLPPGAASGSEGGKSSMVTVPLAGGPSAPSTAGVATVAGAGASAVHAEGGVALGAVEEGRAGAGAGAGGVHGGPGHVHFAGGAATAGAGHAEEVMVGESSWGSIDCVVCMDGVSFPCRPSSYMVTPCDHLFHAQCLRPWMEHKVECPTCRMQLPEP